MANEQYIAQLKETFATSVPNRIAAFIGEPIQVQKTSDFILIICILMKTVVS